MISSDYRLEHVAVGLIERLEGGRRSLPADPLAAREQMERVARAHVAAAVGELRAMAMLDDPDAQAEFLESEVLQTFLPRYARLAGEMNHQEAEGYGLGALAEPLGRIITVAISLLLLLVLLRFAYLPYVWPVIALVAGGAFLPDILRLLTRRRYQRQLQEVVDDMARIQEQQLTYLNAAQLGADTESPLPLQPRDTERRRRRDRPEEER